MASDDIVKFIFVTIIVVASKNWGGPNDAENDINGFNSFKGELRDDVLPFLRDNFNIKDCHNNVALVGLSMNSGQEFFIGILNA